MEGQKKDEDNSLFQHTNFPPQAGAMLIDSLGFDLSGGNSLILLQHLSPGQKCQHCRLCFLTALVTMACM